MVLLHIGSLGLLTDSVLSDESRERREERTRGEDEGASRLLETVQQRVRLLGPEGVVGCDSD